MSKVVGFVLKRSMPEALDALALAQSLSPECRFLLEKEGHHALPNPPQGIEAVDHETFVKEVDLVVVLGGDGTLIHAASLLQERVVPILGVNLGTVGFLAEFPLDDFKETFPKALAGEFKHVDRMRLDVEVSRNGDVVLGRRILNDAVVAQLAMARIAQFKVHFGGRLVTSLRGDGLIVSTPTGSTAYNLAAGGPILTPGLEAIAVTPICPHAVTQRPLVLKPGEVLEISLESDNTVFVTLDGQYGHEFVRGDKMKVQRAPITTRLLSYPGRSYFRTLRTKLGWGES